MLLTNIQNIKLINGEIFSHSRSCVQCLYVFCFQNNMKKSINIQSTSFSVVDSSNNYQGAGTKTKLFVNVMLLRLFSHNSVKTLCFQRIKIFMSLISVRRQNNKEKLGRSFPKICSLRFHKENYLTIAINRVTYNSKSSRLVHDDLQASNIMMYGLS